MTMLTLEQALVIAFEHHKAGRLEAAGMLYRKVIEVAPENPDALHLLGLVTRTQGRLEEALALLIKSTRVRPTFAEAFYNLGNLYHKLARLDEAEVAFGNAIALKPAQGDALKNLGNVLQAKGRLDDALAAYRGALAIVPGDSECHNNVAAVLQLQGRVGPAMASYRQAIAIRPDYAEARNNLGMCLQTFGHNEEAAAQHRLALSLRPEYGECWSNFGSVLFSQGAVEQALTAYRRALTLCPGFIQAHSNFLLTFNYVPGVPAAEVGALHRDFDERHGKPLAVVRPPHANPPEPERRLKIGYYSPDFRRHSCAFFFMPLVAHRDPARVEITCYAHLKNPDAYSERIRALADRWVPVTGETDAMLADRVRADGIDIFVDMAGHFADHKLLAFAAKPAPVQVTWLGYPNTTGLSAIDYRFTDALADPVGEADAVHVERLVRLPQGFICYMPPDDAPPVAPAPVLAGGGVTFGSFNNLNKVQPAVVALWSAILHRVPGSRLALKSMGMGDSATRRRFFDLFASHGISEDRIEVLPWVAQPADHMTLYGRVDIALDPFPYNGTTTTCEALWMGVPVVALAGDRHAARVGVSLLGRVGLESLIAATPEAYVDTAVALAQDPGRLVALRTGMRDRLRRSPLCDAPGFARQVEDAYRVMWRRWCDGR